VFFVNLFARGDLWAERGVAVTVRGARGGDARQECGRERVHLICMMQIEVI
jgi:hypothetical protein